MAKGRTSQCGRTSRLDQSHCHCIYLLNVLVTSLTSQQGRALIHHADLFSFFPPLFFFKKERIRR